MKKLIKIFVIIFLLSGVLFAGALVLIKKLLPPEKIKERLAQEVSARFKREIEVGKIQIGLFKGIVIEDFALSESPNFKSGKFLESKKFSLKFQLLPLLKKKVIVDSIELTAPKIRIVQYADGKTFNFSDLLQKPSETPSVPPPVKAEAPSPLNLTISKAVLSQGKVEFIDKTPRAIKLSLSPIDIVVTGTGLDKPMAVNLSFTLDSFILGKGLKGNLNLSCVLDLPKESVKIEPLLWKMDFLDMEVKGGVENFKSPKFDLELNIPRCDLKAITNLVPIPKGIQLSGTPTLNLSLKGTPNDIQYKGKIGYFSLISEVTGNFKTSPKFDPTFKASLKTNMFELSDFAKLSDLADPYQPKGMLSLGVEVTGPLKLLKAKGNVQLENLEAKYEKLRIESLKGSVEFTENSANIPAMSGKISSEGKTPCEFNLKTSVNNFLKPEISLAANLTTLDVSMFVSDKKKGEKKETSEPEKKDPPKPYKGPQIRTDGKVSVGKVIYSKFEGENLEANWNLSGVTPTLESVDGQLSLQFGQGKIASTPLLTAVAPLLKIDSSSFIYNYLGGNWNVSKGTAQTDDFKVNSPSCDFFLKGSLHLPSRIPNLTLTAKLPKGALGGSLGEFSSDTEGRPTFVFLLKNSWKPTLDTSTVGKKATEKAKEEIKKRATDLLEKEGKKLLEGLFGR